MNTQPQIKTPDQVKQELLNKGITISEWARQHQYTPREVILVLNGYTKARYGKGHQIAVALGLKPSPQQSA